MDTKPEERKAKSGISAVFSSWTWKDFLLVVTNAALFIVVCFYVTSPAISAYLLGGANVPLSTAASSSILSSGSPYICEAGGWLAPPVSQEQDAWYDMKVSLRPARCRVKGKWVIEELDPEHNFRRAWTLGFTDDVEDKYQVLPYMLATQDDTLFARPRRVFIDFGANRFLTSVYWMLRNYPVDFTEIHAFEVNSGMFNLPEPSDLKLHPMDGSSRMVDVPRGPGDIPKWMLDRINFHQQYVTAVDDPGQARISATHFIKEELKLTKDDTVIVKMDIEGSEWDILPGWMEDTDMAEIVDELYVEIHYKEESMTTFGWQAFPHTLQESVDLLVNLRDRGFYVHTWP